MNLATIERMLSQGDLSQDAMHYLLGCHGECEWLDFKERLHLQNDKQICEFTKDVLGMKNVGGGYIVVGVQDKTWKPVGLKDPLPFDSKMLRDKVRKGAGVDLDVDLVHHKLLVDGDQREFALISIRASRKRSKRRTPTLVKTDCCAGKDYGLRRGEIFGRRGDSTVKISTREELEDLLDSLEGQADSDVIAASGVYSPFAVEDGPYRLLEKGYFSFIGRESFREEIIAAISRDPRIWIINVHGPGGVGKSALVNWAVYELYENRAFEAILQLTAKETALTPHGIVQQSRSLYSLENLLDQILETFLEDPPENLDSKKAIAIELLSTWDMLLVLDNMESLNDLRIFNFIQNLPPGVKVKVLMTSRNRSGTWELPVPVNELSEEEVKEFVLIKSAELNMPVPKGKKDIEKILKASGGLPLAIQWILGQYKLAGTLGPAVDAVGKKDSPILEFTFGNIWKGLSSDAKAILAVVSIFDEPPTMQQLLIATEFQMDRIERTLTELNDVTLVTRHTQSSDGRTRYVALPITLTFARHQLQEMGSFEAASRQRYQQYSDQMRLQESELAKMRSRFERYGLDTDNEKRAAILCQRGESDMFVGNTDNADSLFKQAREIAPQSAYVYAMSASYELARNRVGVALEYANEACKRANKRTGSLCYMIKARVLDVQRDKTGRVTALAKALDYDPKDVVIQHQYGVALSRAGFPEEAVKQFDLIIEKEAQRVPPSETLIMALKTRIINLLRMGMTKEAKRDYEWGMEQLKSYPHLNSQKGHFEELEKQL